MFEFLPKLLYITIYIIFFPFYNIKTSIRNWERERVINLHKALPSRLVWRIHGRDRGCMNLWPYDRDPTLRSYPSSRSQAPTYLRDPSRWTCWLDSNILPSVIKEAVIVIPYLHDLVVGAFSASDSSVRISVSLEGMNVVFLSFFWPRILSGDRFWLCAGASNNIMASLCPAFAI